ALAASRYLVTSGGDITRALPVFVKPSPAAASTGNSLAGSNEGTPVRSRTVQVYSALLSRRSTTRPGSPARFAASEIKKLRTHFSSTACSPSVGLFTFLGGISRDSSISPTFCHTGRLLPRLSIEEKTPKSTSASVRSPE